MILPKLSAALLSMSFFGTAYASGSLHGATTPEQWVVVSGASHGAAAVFQASPSDLAQHRATAHAHLERYAREQGTALEGFDALFERGHTEGRLLVMAHSRIFRPHSQALLQGFHHDRRIRYEDMTRALRA